MTEKINIKKIIAVSVGIILLVLTSFCYSKVEAFNYNPEFMYDLPGYDCVIRVMNKSEAFMPFYKAVIYKNHSKYEEIILSDKFDSSRMEYELAPGQLRIYFKDHLRGENSGYILVDLT